MKVNKNKDNIYSAIDLMETFNQVFKGNSIRAKCVDYVIGNTSTRIIVEVLDESHIKHIKNMVSKVSATMNNFPITFTKDVPGSEYSGIEFPNLTSEAIDYEELFTKLPDASTHPTAIPLGKTIEEDYYLPDIRKLRHILIGGSGASGKTNLINNILSTIIKRNSPEKVKLLLIDPTRFEMNVYKDDPHLLCPLVNDPVTCENILFEMVDLMNDRYRLFEKNEYQTSIEEYNKWSLKHNKETIPYIIIVLNEYSMFSTMSKTISHPLISLLQKSYAAGIHVIVLTKKTTPHIINTVMKANITTKIALPVINAFESQNIIDKEEAEKLITGSGEMLVKSIPLCKDAILRLSSPLISTEEVYEIVKESKGKYHLHYNESLLKAFSKSNGSNMKEMYLKLDRIDEDNDRRVLLWGLDQGIITIDKIINELGTTREEANRYIDILYKEGVILKSLEPGIYRVIDEDD